MERLFNLPNYLYAISGYAVNVSAQDCTRGALPSFLMCFFSVNPLIGFAERADVLLDILHEVKDHPFLVMTGVQADRAYFTNLCQ